MFAYALRDSLGSDLYLAGLVEVEQEAAAVLAHEDFSWVRFVDNHDMGRGMHRWDDDTKRLVTQPKPSSDYAGSRRSSTAPAGPHTRSLDVDRRPRSRQGPDAL